MTELGTLHPDGDRRSVRFERIYAATAAELWQALTEPEQLRGWLAEAERYDVEPGGEFELRFGEAETERASGRFRRVEPGRLLELDWRFPGEPPSVVRVELVPHEEGTLLVLDHTGLPADAAAAYGAGWHAHLDLLARGATVDWLERYQELRPRYDEQAAALP